MAASGKGGVRFGYWREPASRRLHGEPHPRCAAGAGQLRRCTLTREQWAGSLRCECAVWWGDVQVEDKPAAPAGELRRDVLDAAPADTPDCAECGVLLVDAEGSEESDRDAAGVVRCPACAALSRTAVEVAELRRSVRRDPFQVSEVEMATASRERRHRRREGLPCPLCGNAISTCSCTARQLACLASRQLPLPVVMPVAPAMPAKPGGQGVLW